MLYERRKQNFQKIVCAPRFVSQIGLDSIQESHHPTLAVAFGQISESHCVHVLVYKNGNSNDSYLESFRELKTRRHRVFCHIVSTQVIGIMIMNISSEEVD